MSCYVLSDSEISVIANAFITYGVDFQAKGYYKKTPQIIVDFNSLKQELGQALLDVNVSSVNYRYDENNKEKFTYDFDVDKKLLKDGKINTGMIYGCIECHEYQSCEIPDYYTSDIHYSLTRLKNKILEKYIKQDGFEIGWGL